ncbi:MAG: protein translocase subunit SecDF [Saprospiraceae bacterium]|nr:protein translocase subunit SecDF [Saprospiraceae bacterium]
MQGKGLLKFFLTLIAIVSVVQLLYFIPTNRVEKEAIEYAANKASNVDELSKSTTMKIAKAKFLDSISDETILEIPGLANYSYADLKKRQLGFGLDLKGGMSAVLQVDLRGVLTALAGSKKNDPDFVAALDKASLDLESSSSDYITLFSNAYRDIADGKKMGKLFQRSKTLGEINNETSDGEVIKLLRTAADETVDRTFKMLKERIDRSGVVQPNISLDASRDLILVEMPGVDNPKRMRDLIQASAQLEFWDTYRVTDPGIINMFQDADKRLATINGEEVVAKMDTIYTPQYDEDGNIIDSTQVIQPSTDVFGAQGPLLSKLKLNGLGGQQYYATVMGLVNKKDVSFVKSTLNSEDIRTYFPKNSRFAFSYKPYKNQEGDLTDEYELYLIKTTASGQAPLEGDVVIEASQQIDPTTGEPEVSLSMNSDGAKKWAKMTEIAYNNGGREIAITLDSQVVSAPGVNNGAITGGRSSISGSFTIQEAVDFANILEVGKLPAKTNIIQESIVGPSLGAKNIKSSVTSLIIGFVLLLLFMLFYYGKGGLVSIIALLANMFFIFGTLSSLGTVLTLPGIAGIVLTIGMAVDANVIIFERIREELRAGKSTIASIADGFRASYSAIIDANVTTLLVATVLAYYGLGPIKGFAVVLIIGVLSSLLTAVLFGKLIIDGYTASGKEMSFWSGWSKNAFANLTISWMSKRKVAYIVSTVLIVAGLASIFTRGFNLGVDFKGGYAYDVQFGENVSQEDISTALTDVFGGAPIVKTVDTDNTYQITTDYLIDDKTEGNDQLVMAKLYEGLKNIDPTASTQENFEDSSFDAGMHVISSSKVGPTIADDIRVSSLKAGLFALILIFLYIFIRFNKWQYSMGAVAALFHDSLIVLGLFSLLKDVMPFSLEIDQAFIAAILTVIGYSINDTVVVFDRIREYLGIYTNKEKDEILDSALNSTFSRTVITSLTTLIVVAILLIFGGSTIKGFAFALLIGILVGTYSSIFVATPIVRDLSDDLKGTVRKSNKSNDSGGFGRAAKRAAASAE